MSLTEPDRARPDAAREADTSPLRGGRSQRSESSAGFGWGSSADCPSPPPEIRTHRAPRDASDFNLPARGRSHADAQADGEPSPAELMNQVYQRQRHIYDLTRKYFLLGRDRLIRELKPPQGGTVLEIGCGTGRNLIAAARAYPEARFFGLDISTKMLATARANIRQAGLERRITLGCADAADFDAETLFQRRHFDRAFLSYSLSMIPAWREALAAAREVLAPEGGRLLIVDFGEQERLPAWFRRALFAWLGRFHVTPRPELEAALLALAGESGARAEFQRLYRGYACQAALTR